MLLQRDWVGLEDWVLLDLSTWGRRRLGKVDKVTFADQDASMDVKMID